jgi:predicted ATPase
MRLEGETLEALPVLRAGHDAFRAGGARLTLPFQFCELGKAYMQAGRFEDARRALEEGRAVAEDTDERCSEAELCRLEGERLLAEGVEGDAAAENCFRLAIDTARRQRSLGWELRATTSLARLYRARGREAEARAALEPVYGAYTEGFTTPDLVDAAALLEALGSPVVARATP